MTIECWVALCPHCHIVWPVDSWKEPRFLDHGQSETMTREERAAWDAKYNTVRDVALLNIGSAGNVEHLELAASTMEALMKERRAQRIRCPGDKRLALGPVVLNGSPEADQLVDEASAWHKAHRAEIVAACSKHKLEAVFTNDTYGWTVMQCRTCGVGDVMCPQHEKTCAKESS